MGLRKAIAAVAIILSFSSSLLYASSEPEAIMRSGIFPSSKSNGERPKESPYVLMGTFIADSFKEAVIFLKDKRTFVKVKEGDKLDRYSVGKIDRRAVILYDGSRKLRLSMPSEEAKIARSYTRKMRIRKSESYGTSSPKAKFVNNRTSHTKPKASKGVMTSSSRTTVQDRRKTKAVVNFIELIKKALKSGRASGAKFPNPFHIKKK